MDSKEIENLLCDSDALSSSLSEFDDSDEDPDWQNDNDENYENNMVDCDSNADDDVESEWNDNFDIPNINSNIIFNPHDSTGINTDIIDTMNSASPFDFFTLFFDDEVVNLIVMETNKYAHDKLNTPGTSNQSRINKWTDIDKDELHEFFGIIMWMGLVKMPSISHYWKTSVLYKSEIPFYMSRNRFELILSVIHVSDNNNAPGQNRLYKIQPLVDILVDKFNTVLIPEKNVCIDESMVPFRGRLMFRQYIANKRHRYGVKIFKLCCHDFYTLQYKIYAGKEADIGQSVSTKVVMQLMEPYLDEGRCLFIDNWYTSIDLAEKLLDRKTHVVGTLRANRKRNPTEVIKKKLVRGGVVARRNRRGIMVLKWKDRRDVLMLSTKHDNSMISFNRRRTTIEKPRVVADYNKGKGYIDMTDQMGSYHTCLRKSIKWYRKLIFDIICNTSMVNALSIYTSVTGRKMALVYFREAVILGLLQNKTALDRTENEEKHTLEKTSKIGRCKRCYENISKTKGNLKYFLNSLLEIFTFFF